MNDVSAVVQAINHVIPMIRKYYDEGPGSLSRHLYWWRDGSLRLLPAEVEPSGITFHPPGDFVDVLNGLA